MGQEIYFSRDTLRIDNVNYRDSIVIYNRGISLLKIDSIKSTNTNYTLSFTSNNKSYGWKILEELVNPDSAIEIPPNDSIKVLFGVAHILVKRMKVNYDQIDTMYFYNNSINSPVQKIEITNKLIMGGANDEEIPDGFSLSQNYPNPFNPYTKINYSVPKTSFVILKVYDMLGKEVITLVNEEKTIGNYEINFDGSKLSSGVYFYTLSAGSFSLTKKMNIIK